MGHPKLHDIVALLQPLPPEALHLTDERYALSTGLEVGAVGTVVEAYLRDTAPAACLVECSDAYGRGYAFATVAIEGLLVLHYLPSEAMTAQSSHGVGVVPCDHLPRSSPSPAVGRCRAAGAGS